MAVAQGLAMSRTGRWLLVTTATGRELVDLVGTMPTRAVEASADAVVRFVARELWVVTDGTLARLAPTDLRALAQPVRLPGPVTEIIATGGAAMAEAVLVGQPTLRGGLRGDALVFEGVTELRGDERLVTGLGARLYLAAGDSLRATERGREVWRLAKLDGTVLDVVNLFGGRAVAVWLRRDGDDAIAVIQAHGQRVHQVPVPTCARWAVAEELGHAFVVGVDGEVARLDLRYGRVIARGQPILAPAELVVDQDGRNMVVLGADTGEAIHIQAAELLRAAPATADVDPPADTTAAEPIEELEVPPPRPAAGREHRVTAAPAPAVPDARAAAAPPPSLRPPPRPIEVPALLPLAFGPAPPPAAPTGDGTSPYASARAHLDALLAIVAARTAVAIADAWHSGRLSPPTATRRPHELEVEALLGVSGGFAPDKLAEAKARLVERQQEAAARAQASAEAGVRLPFPALVRELGLSPVAAQVLLVAVAPVLRGEIARLFGVLSNDPARPMVDRFLVEQIIAGERSTLRDQIARELAPDAVLVRHGLIQVEPAPATLFARLSAPDALLDRLRGLAPTRVDDIAQVRKADVPLDALLIDPAVKRRVVLALAEPTPPHAPLRLVLRGRRGSGRHSLIAAVAARIEREIVAIDTARLPHARRELVAGLRTSLFRASLHGLVPVLSGLEQIEPTDVDVLDAVRQVLRTHPGPLCVRTSPEGNLPLDPGFVSVVLPPLTETERATAWRSILATAGVTADADRLASRYRIGPGIIRRVVSELTVAGAGRGDATNALDEQVRQHVAARLDHVAKRVERTAHWEDVALPDELLDSLREFIGRARHRRTVYERWGYDAKMTTSRGLTALFYGPPGTGKTMVAGVIAQELGLDMFRVDLARVVSKWVGETEKNLSEVFDAAEDGQVLILFDEADSLFSKRTDVKTSNDRYANLEVNYLLQRLDTFEGIAILTSNLDGSIDPAFKRRLSLRLQFPFPDEETRVRLWSAHVTPETPVAGDFDFVDLARRFPLSGGYIRNCALRAAFLAAHEGEPMGQAHLLRAIQLEYREMGKLSTSSRLE
ncbi:MAG: ATP-binding protein [Kofleriaceae bacterium]